MLVTLFRFLSIFPLSVLHFSGAALGWLVYLLSGSYRRRLKQNITRAGFPGHLHVKPLIEGARARDNLLLAPANFSGVRIMAKALKKGEAIGLLPDQVPQEGEGVWAKFFGKRAYTMTLSAKLHGMTDAPIILTFAERLPGGRGYVIRFVPFEEELGTDPVAQATAINRGMEKLIALSPAQYFWSYNRYKKPDGVDDPEAGADRESA
ncbi:MAG: hypothetical protein HYR68_08580 [Burkholderiales bacterium]|nr:hypothetical protein [Burkholderiales bacterium]